MRYYFELYLLGDAITPEQWTKLYKAIAQYSGRLQSFQVIFSCQDNTVRFFIVSNRDLSGLSNNLEGAILRPVGEEQIQQPVAHGKDRFVKFVTGGSLLDLKEKYAIKKTKDLQFALINVRIVSGEKAMVRMNLYFEGAGKALSKASKLMTFFPSNLLAVDFKANTKYLRKTMPKYLNIEKSLHIMSADSTDALVEIDTFPYFSKPHYLKITDYEFDKHSFIVGASGSGKSKFIALLIDRLQRTNLKMNYRVVVIDPHAALADDLSYIPSTKIVNFKGESAELFPGAGADISAATELTTTLFGSLLADQFNPRLERVLRFSLFVLFTGQTMSLDFLKRFLTELELRTQVLDHVRGHIPENIVRFFGTDFNEIKTQHYNEAIQPIVAMVDEMQLQPGLSGAGDVSLAKTITDNFLTVFSLNKVSMGEKVVKTVAGLLMQQIFLLAQARLFKQRIILIIDEVSIIQNPAMAQMLAEARKFNLTIILTQQYFGQIEKNLRDAILSNVLNYYAFKVSEEDAKVLEGNLNIELPKELLEQGKAKGQKESDLRVKLMTELHPRECIVRVSAGGQLNPAFKARTVDAPGRTSNAPATFEHSTSAEKLKAYKQAEITPFKEDTKATVSTSHTNKTETYAPNSAAPTIMPGMSLSEILISQSSSRLKIRK